MVSLFLSVVGIYSLFCYQGNCHRGKAAGNHQPEEAGVAQRLLQIAGKHARYHHAERHEGGADGIVRGLELAFGEVHHVEHIGGEAEAIAELVEGNGGGDEPQAGGLRDGEVDECQAGQGQGACHQTDGTFQSDAGGIQSAQDAAHGEGDDTDGAIDQSHFGSAQRQSACLLRSYEERGAHLQQEGFGQAVEQHEGDGKPYARLGEVGAEGASELVQDGACACR